MTSSHKWGYNSLGYKARPKQKRPNNAPGDKSARHGTETSCEVTVTIYGQASEISLEFSLAIVC